MFSEIRIEILTCTARLTGLSLDYICDLTIGLSDVAAAIVCLNLCRIKEVH